MSPPFLGCLLIRSFLYLQVRRTCIKPRTSSNFGQIGPLTTELAALEFLKNSQRLIMRKWCLHASSFFFYRTIIKVAGNQDRHERLVEFDFVAESDHSFWSYLSLSDQRFTFMNLNISKASWLILIKFYL